MASMASLSRGGRCPRPTSSHACMTIMHPAPALCSHARALALACPGARVAPRVTVVIPRSCSCASCLVNALLAVAGGDDVEATVADAGNTADEGAVAGGAAALAEGEERRGNGDSERDRFRQRLARLVPMQWLLQTTQHELARLQTPGRADLTRDIEASTPVESRLLPHHLPRAARRAHADTAPPPQPGDPGSRALTHTRPHHRARACHAGALPRSSWCARGLGGGRGRQRPLSGC